MKQEELQAIRREYTKDSLDENDVYEDPLKQFEKWLEEAVHSEIQEPNAMSLATVDDDNQPQIRIVLLKGVEDDAFIFYTNYASDKGKEIENQPKVSLCFFWKELERQVRITGRAEKLDQRESEEYFKSRPYESRIGAHASNQSSEVPNRAFLEEEFERLKQKYPEDKEVPRPETWGGYKVEADSFEFWQGRPGRLHDRIKYIRSDSDDQWIIKRLSP